MRSVRKCENPCASHTTLPPSSSYRKIQPQRGQIVRNVRLPLASIYATRNFCSPRIASTDRRQFCVACGYLLTRTDQQPRIVDAILHVLRQHRDDFRRSHCAPLCPAARRCAAPPNAIRSTSASISSSENISGGNMKPGSQHVANARFTIDMRALPNQGCDVAIKYGAKCRVLRPALHRSPDGGDRATPG